MCNCDTLYIITRNYVNNVSKCVNNKNMHRIFLYLRVMYNITHISLINA